jgi:hypothetical protein
LNPAPTWISVGVVRFADRSVAGLAVAFYLAAAFLPCEPLSAMDVDEIDAAHTTHHAHQTHADGNDSHDSHDVHDANDANEVDHAAARSYEAALDLEFKPTCLCGCADTRGQIGGNAARLGSVVPATQATCQFEAVPLVIAAHAPDAQIDIHLEIDPIPI